MKILCLLGRVNQTLAAIVLPQLRMGCRARAGQEDRVGEVSGAPDELVRSFGT